MCINGEPFIFIVRDPSALWSGYSYQQNSTAHIPCHHICMFFYLKKRQEERRQPMVGAPVLHNLFGVC